MPAYVHILLPCVPVVVATPMPSATGLKLSFCCRLSGMKAVSKQDLSHGARLAMGWLLLACFPGALSAGELPLPSVHPDQLRPHIGPLENRLACGVSRPSSALHGPLHRTGLAYVRASVPAGYGRANGTGSPTSQFWVVFLRQGSNPCGRTF